MDAGVPQIYALIAYPLLNGEVILSRQDLVTLEDAEAFHQLGWIVLIDPVSEQAYHDWHRWKMGHWGQW